MKEVVVQEPSECSCERCREACENVPGMFHPAEAMLAIAAGHAKRLVPHLLIRTGITVIAPGAYHPEIGERYGHQRIGRCTFLDAGKCELHHTGFKPIECREARLCAPRRMTDEEADRFDKLWDTPEGEAALKAWMDAQ